VGLLGCKILYPDGSIQHECARNFPELRTSLLDSFYLQMVFPKSRVFGRSLMTYWDHDDSRAVPCILGAFMLFRRQVLEEVGLFDTTVPMYLDDIDLCYRVGQTRWRTYYLASVHIIHKGGRSEAQTARTRDPVAINAIYVFFLKHRGRWAARCFRGIMVCRALFRLTLATVLAPLRPVLTTRQTSLKKALVIERHVALLRWSLSPQTLTVTGR
jgi:GT2 family glycosyltransferase